MNESLSDQLRFLTKVNKHIVIPIIGDCSKTLLLPLWAKIAEIPGAWYQNIDYNNHVLTCNLWDIQQGVITHMYPSDEVDHTIIVYDISFRYHKPGQSKYMFIDYLNQVLTMKGSYKQCSIIIIKNRDNDDISKILADCRHKHIKKIYTLSKTSQCMQSLTNLVKDVAVEIYQERYNQAQIKIQKLMSN